MPGTPYLTKAELRAEPWNVPESEASDARLDALLSRWKDRLDLACLQRFDDHTRSITCQGNGSTLLQPTLFDTLPYGRMRALTSITVDGVSKGVTLFQVRPWQIVWLPEADDIFAEEFPKDRPVIVGLTCGWTTIPPDIKDLLGRLILRELRPELAEGAKHDSESVSGYSYTMRRLTGPSPFGDPELDGIVQEFRFPGVWAAV